MSMKGEKWVNMHCNLLKSVEFFLNGTKLYTGGSISANKYTDRGTDLFGLDLILCTLQSLLISWCHVQADELYYWSKIKIKTFFLKHFHHQVIVISLQFSFLTSTP